MWPTHRTPRLKLDAVSLTEAGYRKRISKQGVRPADRVDLTGKEYAKVMELLRRWHDVPPL